MEHTRLIPVPEHCALLSRILSHPELNTVQYHRKVTTSDGETLDWSDAAEWLYTAASVDHVTIDTTRFDDSVMMCRPAWEYESARSELLTRLVTQLTIFNFVWGAFETLVKVIDPPKVPKDIKPGAGSIDAVLFYLKNEYEPKLTVECYQEVLNDLAGLLRTLPQYGNLSGHFKLQPHVGISGMGINVIRRLRNKMAHGTMTLPLPDVNNAPSARDAELVESSSRLVLLTVQMLLRAYFKDETFDVDCLRDGDGSDEDEDVHSVLMRLHLRMSDVDPDQPTLF